MVTIGVLIALLAGCGAKPGHEKTPSAKPPATVRQISSETELATVTLSKQAENRLGVAVAKLGKEEVADNRLYSGLVVVPPQERIVMTAPVAGTLRYIGSTKLAVGSAVQKGQTIFSLAPTQTNDSLVLGPALKDQLRSSRISIAQSEAGIKTRIDAALVELKASKIELDRSTQLFREKVGSKKRVDDAQARMLLAEQTLQATRRELDTLRSASEQPVLEPPPPLLEKAPLTGNVFNLQVSCPQSVYAGQPLMEIVGGGALWIRLRIPESEVTDVLREGKAQVLIGDQKLQASPVRGLPSADPLTATQDIYYQLDSHLDSLSPDQRLEVIVPLKTSGNHLVVPSSAIVYDLHGGTWVYGRSGPQVYRRYRVIVLSQNSRQAVLEKAPPQGSLIVVAGAAELFGIEFGND